MFGGNAVAAAAAAAAAAGIPTPAIFGIMDSYFAAKMADRVTCDICNKQVREYIETYINLIYIYIYIIKELNDDFNSGLLIYFIILQS